MWNEMWFTYALLLLYGLNSLQFLICGNFRLAFYWVFAAGITCAASGLGFSR